MKIFVDSLNIHSVEVTDRKVEFKCIYWKYNEVHNIYDDILNNVWCKLIISPVFMISFENSLFFSFTVVTTIGREETLCQLAVCNSCMSQGMATSPPPLRRGEWPALPTLSLVFHWMPFWLVPWDQYLVTR